MNLHQSPIDESVQTSVIYRYTNGQIQEYLEQQERQQRMEPVTYTTSQPAANKTKKEAAKTIPNYTLTPRDQYVLTWIGEMYNARLDIVQRLLGANPGKGSKDQREEGKLTQNRTARIIAKWRTMGLVDTRKVVGDEPVYIWLTIKGLRTVGLDYKEHAPALSTVKHNHVVNIVRLYLELKNPTATWRSERAMRGEAETMDAKERKGKHLPDGIMILQTAHEYAVEVELARKSSKRLSAIAHLLNHDYTGTLYFVNTTTKDPITEATLPYNKDTQKFTVKDIATIYHEVNLYG